APGRSQSRASTVGVGLQAAHQGPAGLGLRRRRNDQPPSRFTLVTAGLSRSAIGRTCLVLGWSFPAKWGVGAALTWVGAARATTGGGGTAAATGETATAASMRAALLSTTAGSDGGSVKALLGLVPLSKRCASPVKRMVSPFDKIRKPCPVMSPE